MLWKFHFFPSVLSPPDLVGKYKLNFNISPCTLLPIHILQDLLFWISLLLLVLSQFFCIKEISWRDDNKWKKIINIIFNDFDAYFIIVGQYKRMFLIQCWIEKCTYISHRKMSVTLKITLPIYFHGNNRHKENNNSMW